MTFTVNELAACVVADQIRNGDLAFVGVGSTGRAFALAVGIPLVAARLAQLTHAPDATVFWGNLLNPDLSIAPKDMRQRTLTRWPASACLSDTGFKCDMLGRRRFDVSFNSGAQIDRHGNLNITAIGDYRRPDVRLVGALAQPEHFAFVPRPIVMMDLGRRTFLEQVDFVTSVGHRVRGAGREELGLPPGGPSLVVTERAIFDFDPQSHGMRLVSLHPGVSLGHVLDAMGFEPIVPGHVPTTKTPTERELHLIRSVIDPQRTLIAHESQTR